MKINKYYKNKEYIHYSNCHEDANMILSNADKGINNILSIASGGDNSFACLLLKPNQVIAIDTNIAQIYLVKLKAIAIKYLNHEEFLIFIGIKEGNCLEYFNKIKHYLDNEVQQYFEDNLFLINEVKLVNCGRFEYYFRIFRNKILTKIHSKKTIDMFMNFESLEAQKEFYKRKFNNWRFRFLFKIFFSKFVMKRLGRDKEYFNYHKGNFAKQLKTRFELGINNNLNKHNPYLQYVVYNKFVDLPLYLKKENFDLIKDNIDKLIVKHISLDEQLKEDLTYDFMNLSDVFEYVDNKLMSHYEKVIYNRLNNNGKLIFWNMQNTRLFGEKLSKQPVSIQNDLAYYYKDVLVYKKD